MRLWRKVAAIVSALSLVLSGCFGSELREMGEHGYARSIAVEQGIGLGLLVGGGVFFLTYEMPEGAWMTPESLLISTALVTGGYLLHHGEQRTARDVELAHLRRAEPGLHAEWTRRNKRANAVIGVGAAVVVLGGVASITVPQAEEDRYDRQAYQAYTALYLAGIATCAVGGAMKKANVVAIPANVYVGPTGCAVAWRF